MTRARSSGCSARTRGRPRSTTRRRTSGVCRRRAVATAIRLFFLELPVAREEAERALGGTGCRGARAHGARTRRRSTSSRSHASRRSGRSCSPPTGCRPTRRATRPTTSPRTRRPRGSATCSRRARGSTRALDVGTGNGVQALLAAGHSEHVVATDVNPRALAFTELNAALSGIETSSLAAAASSSRWPASAST